MPTMLESIQQGRIRLVREETVGLTTTVSRVAVQRPNRVAITITNQGTTDANVRRKQPATATAGMRLAPGATAVYHYLETYEGESIFTDWYAIAISGTPDLYIEELEAF